jgi:rhodanese-related sulfurtransferase
MVSGCAAAPVEAPAPVVNDEAVDEQAETDDLSVIDDPTELTPVAAQPGDLNTSYDLMLGSMEEYNFIKPDVLNAMIIGGNTPFLLDVRQPEELAKDG